MGQRIRTVKPDFFTHEGLADLPVPHRLLFVGLWTLADKRGRLLDRPRRIKVAVFPYDDQIGAAEVDSMLIDLAEHQDSFLVRYSVGGKFLIEIPGFLEHQRPHHKEPDSTLPGSDGKNSEIQARPMQESMIPTMTIQGIMLGPSMNGEGKGREGKE